MVLQLRELLKVASETVEYLSDALAAEDEERFKLRKQRDELYNQLVQEYGYEPTLDTKLIDKELDLGEE